MITVVSSLFQTSTSEAAVDVSADLMHVAVKHHRCLKHNACVTAER